MFRVLNAEPEGYSPEARAILESVAEVDVEGLDRPALLARLPDYDVLIVRLGFQIDDEVLAAGEKLRAVASATTGLDHIDVESAGRRGVVVLSLKGEFDFLNTVYATVEHTWALLLALLRRIPSAFDSVRAGEWERDRFRGRELHGKVLGIVGLGRIGAKIAGYGRAFGMRVLACDPYVESWPDFVEPCAELVELLEQADVVSLHVPLDDATTGLFGAREMAAMKPGALLLNTSRGAVLDETALLAALEDGRLAGAALDVLCGEKALMDGGSHPLVAYAHAHDNLLITPHVGGATFESMTKTEVFMAIKIKRFLLEGS